ncbi:MAG: hypothetical protein E7468_04165 [Ruminococcaceae bacterium]|nr:hypothetical protein [Oscillospiraceae bacterium]
MAVCRGQTADLSRCAPSVAVPGDLLGASTCVTRRPLPLAQVASSATGGAPFAPPMVGMTVSVAVAVEEALK